MYKNYLTPINVVIALLAVVSIAFGFFYSGVVAGFLNIIIWAGSLAITPYIRERFALKSPLSYVTIVVAVVLSVVAVFVLEQVGSQDTPTPESASTGEQSPQREGRPSREDDPFAPPPVKEVEEKPGTFSISAKDGKVSGKDSSVGKKDKGEGLYLASQDAKATYEFDVPKYDNYTMWVRASKDSTANVTFMTTNGQVATYMVPEEKLDEDMWVEVVNFVLNDGKETFTIEMEPGSEGFFHMYEIKLVPQGL